ncbi:uncharacterized protein WCC33_014712 [Rhinophrynus dorsalis]
MASAGLEEEELWLYGGSPTHDEEDEENVPASGHTLSSEGLQDTSAGSQEQKDVLQQVTQSCSDTEEDSDQDSDDDVRVTIGDIRTGLPSCMGSAGNADVRTARGYGASGKLQQKGIDFSAPGCINGIPVLEVDLDSFDEKPWRKPGADLSDYFNYGFNEATWKVYCEKQRQLQMGLDSSYHPNSKENRITVQQGRTGNSDNSRENGSVNTELKSNVCGEGKAKSAPEASANRKSGGTIDVVCSITTVEGRRWDTHESEDIPIQVIGDQGYKPHTTIQHQQPPPPLLPPPTITMNHPPPPFSGLPLPPPFFQRPPPTTQAPPPLHPPALLPPPLLPPPSVHIPPLNGTHVSYSSRPPPRHGYNSVEPGIMTYTPVSTVHTPWVTTTDKGTSSLGGSDWLSRRERDMERTRTQTSNSYKNEGNRYLYYSRERNYEYEHNYQRSRERSWEREERPRGEQRHRDKDESSKHKSSRRKPESEERESHRRHKRKKNKRGKEEKSSSDDITGGSRRNSRE